MESIIRVVVLMLLLVNVQVHAQLLNTSDWQPDILNNFEDKTFTFTDDYEGAVTAHLIRKMSDTPTNKSSLIYSWVCRLFLSRRVS